MRAGRAVMCVDDDDGDDDGGDDKHHREQHVFPYEGDSAGGGGDQLHDNQQEDSQRQQDGDGEGHLLTWSDGHTLVKFLPTYYKLVMFECFLCELVS